MRSAASKPDPKHYNIHFILSEVVQILQIERHSVVVLHCRVLFFGNHVLTHTQNIIDQIEQMRINLAVEDNPRRIDPDRHINRIRNVVGNLRMRVVLALNLNVLAANEIRRVLAVSVANLPHGIASMRLEGHHDRVFALVIRHVSEQNRERERGQRVVVKLRSGDGRREGGEGELEIVVLIRERHVVHDVVFDGGNDEADIGD